MEQYLRKLDLPSEELARIRMTTSCTDCEQIPKVADAGRVVDNYQIMHNGVRVLADGYCGPWMTAIIQLLRGHHEPQEELAFHSILPHVRPGSLILELGCYWSYYSLWYLSQVRDSRAILVEPDLHCLGIGKTNFELNQRTGEFHHAAIGRTPGTTPAFRCESDQVERPVRIMTVDEILKGQTAEILLADIQGAELDMLYGAVESIRAGNVRFLLVSTHHHCISGDPLTHQKCLDFVVAHGGTVLTEHTVSESFSGDGLIVVSFDRRDCDLPKIELSRNRATTSLFRPIEYDLAEANAEIARLRIQNDQELQRLTSSRSWRLTSPFRGLAGAVRRLRDVVRVRRQKA